MVCFALNTFFTMILDCKTQTEYISATVPYPNFQVSTDCPKFQNWSVAMQDETPFLCFLLTTSKIGTKVKGKKSEGECFSLHVFYRF